MQEPTEDQELLPKASLLFRASPLDHCVGRMHLSQRSHLEIRRAVCLLAFRSVPSPSLLCSFSLGADTYRLHLPGPNKPGACREEESSNQSISSFLPVSEGSLLGSSFLPGSLCQGSCSVWILRIPPFLLTFQSRNAAIFLWMLLSGLLFTQVCPSVSSNAFKTSFPLSRFLE